MERGKWTFFLPLRRVPSSCSCIEKVEPRIVVDSLAGGFPRAAADFPGLDDRFPHRRAGVFRLGLERLRGY